MAQSEGENDCDMDQEATKQECSEKDESECDKTVSSSGATSTGATTATPSKGAGSSSGAASISRRSRRKQSDPRRVGSEIVKMEVVEIKSEIIDQDDSDSNEKDPEDHFDDDVFLKVRTNALSPIPGTPTSSERLEGSLVHDQSRDRIGDRDRMDVLQRGVDNGDDCQPQDLSMSSKKRDHNRVVLAIPSVVRPTKPKGTQLDLGRRNESDSANASTHSQISQNNAHVFRTFAHDLQAEGLVGLERDYRLKYRHDFDDDYHDSHSHAIIPHQEYPTPLPFAIAHQHKVILDSQECNSQGIACGDHKETNGKTSPSTSTSSSSSTSQSSKSTNKPGRSYKNLSRSRRIVANARERNRVHTISAAFEGLRRAVPSYSHNQKLSKLAILRIACSYILALAKLADLDYSPEDEQQMSFEDCVDLCTETLQAEGRSKRRKVRSLEI
ncbi:uncharacterized protein LOC129273637 [Lytechinus pictus]|uniref:uncharacterized protein LOC129273637 n=1 Tax=Lytechinus pictus TaxID=7653 RepID=UPI0030BA033B